MAQCWTTSPEPWCHPASLNGGHQLVRFPGLSRGHSCHGKVGSKEWRAWLRELWLTTVARETSGNLPSFWVRGLIGYVYLLKVVQVASPIRNNQTLTLITCQYWPWQCTVYQCVCVCEQKMVWPYIYFVYTHVKLSASNCTCLWCVCEAIVHNCYIHPH